VVGVLVFLLAGAGLRAWYLLDRCPIDLAGDEAHYWEWSRRLDLSYYSKGPLVAYLIAGSCRLLGGASQAWTGSEMFAVRAPALVLSILTGLGIFVLARRTLGDDRLAFWAVAATATMPILAVGSSLMTIDNPFVWAWTWALVALREALRRDGWGWWLACGGLIAIGILAKYTMVLILPAGGLAMLIEPSWRRYFRRPGPYLAAAIGLGLGLLPIVLWNARHGWVSFRHVGGQAGVVDGVSWDLAGVLGYIAGQAVVVNAVWFAVMLVAAWFLARRPEPQADEAFEPRDIRFLVWTMLTPWAAFLLFSPVTKVQPNWPVPALVAGSVVLVVGLRRWRRSGVRWHRRAAVGALALGTAGGLAATVFMYHAEWFMPVFARLARNAPVWDPTPAARYDPVSRLRGWAELGRQVGEVLAAERAAGRDPFIVADHYQKASEIAFYCPGEPVVYCVQSALGDRLCQYDLWPNPIDDPREFVGRPCIYVGSVKAELREAGPGRLPPMPGLKVVRTAEFRVQGRPIRVTPICVCGRFAGFGPPAAVRSRKY